MSANARVYLEEYTERFNLIVLGVQCVVLTCSCLRVGPSLSLDPSDRPRLTVHGANGRCAGVNRIVRRPPVNSALPRHGRRAGGGKPELVVPPLPPNTRHHVTLVHRGRRQTVHGSCWPSRSTDDLTPEPRRLRVTVFHIVCVRTTDAALRSPPCKTEPFAHTHTRITRRRSTSYVTPARSSIGSYTLPYPSILLRTVVLIFFSLCPFRRRSFVCSLVTAIRTFSPVNRSVVIPLSFLFVASRVRTTRPRTRNPHTSPTIATFDLAVCRADASQATQP